MLRFIAHSITPARAWALLALPLVLLSTCGPSIINAPEHLPPFSAQLNRCEKWMGGSFQSTDTQLYQTRIWSSAPKAIWIYSELQSSEQPKRPLEQRVYQLTDGLDGSVRVATYDLPGDPLDFAGAWQDPRAFNSLDPANLSLRGGCTISLRTTAGGGFNGSTQGQGCDSPNDSARYRTMSMTVRSLAIERWPRDFNAQGQQVAGPTDRAILYKRTNAAAMPQHTKPGTGIAPDLGPYEAK